MWPGLRIVVGAVRCSQCRRQRPPRRRDRDAGARRGRTIGEHDHNGGVSLPLATFLGAFAVGLSASVAGRWIKEARVALTVPAVVMMVPGLSALETLVYFDRGEILKGLSAGVLVGFVVGSIAFGLAAARFISQPEWLRE